MMLDGPTRQYEPWSAIHFLCACPTPPTQWASDGLLLGGGTPCWMDFCDATAISIQAPVHGTCECARDVSMCTVMMLGGSARTYLGFRTSAALPGAKGSGHRSFQAPDVTHACCMHRAHESQACGLVRRSIECICGCPVRRLACYASRPVWLRREKDQSANGNPRALRRRLIR